MVVSYVLYIVTAALSNRLAAKLQWNAYDAVENGNGVGHVQAEFEEQGVDHEKLDFILIQYTRNMGL